MKDTGYVTLRMALVEAMANLETGLGALAVRLRAETDFPLWVDGIDDSVAARQAVIRILTQIDYLDGQDPRRTERCTALAGVHPDTLELASDVNAAKAAVGLALKRMEGLKTDVGDGAARRQEPLIKVALRAVGHPRLHRRQAVRRIELLDRAPAAATFTWARSRKVERWSLDRVLSELQGRLETSRSSNPAYAALCRSDIQRIEALRGQDSREPLAMVEPAHAHPRANLVWTDADGAVTRRQRRAVTPLLYPARAGDPLPRIRPLPASMPPREQRLTRRDKTVEDAPYLTAIPIHRYRQ